MIMRMRLGLAGDLIPRDPAAIVPDLARGLASLGISAIVTHFGAPHETLAGAAGARVRAVLADAGIRIVQAAGVDADLVSPDERMRAASLARLRAALAAARALGAEMLLSGCGSRHSTAFYGPSPLNHRPEARERLAEGLRLAVPLLEDAGVPLALECHVLTTLDTPEHVRAILRAVGSPLVRANFDPVNLLGDLPSLYGNGAAMRRMVETLAPHYAPCAHVKDAAVQPDLVLHIAEVPPGRGLLDYPAFFAACTGLGDGSALVVEHLPAALVPAALDFVRAAAARHGISLERAPA